MTQEEEIKIHLHDHAYSIFIGEEIFSTLPLKLRSCLARPQLVIITDNNVAQFHLKGLVSCLHDSGIITRTITLPAGEKTKSFDQLARMCCELITMKVERSDTIVALGGGVVGDIVGFAAAILHRGINFIQIPTTLLAQIDSSVGGKTAINIPQGKNLVGAFHQPGMVVTDLSTLETLPKRELKAGYAEMVKYGLIDNAEFFSWLETNGKAIGQDSAITKHAIATCCRAKAAIVARDEKEKGERALLNLGHTFGHALEALAGYDGRLLHGEAVGVGCVLALDLSVRLGLAKRADYDRLRNHLENLKLMTNIKETGIKASAREILASMYNDKKTNKGRLRLILGGIGKAKIVENIEPAAIIDTLDASLKGR